MFNRFPSQIWPGAAPAMWRPFSNRFERNSPIWPGAPPAYKSIRKVAAGAHFPTGGPGSARQRQIYTKTGLRRAFPSRWPREAPASVQIYTKSGRWGPFPSKWPRERPPASNLYQNWPPEGGSQQVAQGNPRQRTNLYEKWPLGPISQQVAQGAAQCSNY